MELRDYVAIVGRYRFLFAAIVITATVLTSWLAARQPQRFEGSATLTVFQDGPTQQAAGDPYQFDSFYTIQGASLFADQLKGYLADPAFVNRVFVSAQVPLPAERLTKLARAFTVRKIDPSSVQVSYDETNEQSVRSVLSQSIQLLTAETAALKQEGAFAAMQVRSTEPVVFAYETSVALAAVVSAVSSALVALTLIFLIEFARPRTK